MFLVEIFKRYIPKAYGSDLHCVGALSEFDGIPDT